MLLAGLPLLSASGKAQVTFADLYSRASVIRKFVELGLNARPVATGSKSIVSSRSGILRKVDIAAAVPKHLWITFRLISAMQANDVVYLHGYKDLVLCHAARLALGARAPAAVWHCHGLGDPSGLPMLVPLANRCSRVIAISDDVRKHLVEAGVKSDIVSTIYNALDLDRVQAASHLNPSRPLPANDGRKVILVCPAAIRFAKGIHLAIAALRDLPNAVVWITGDESDPVASPYLTDLRTLGFREGVSERVFFIGSRNDLPAVMSHVDVVCVPSVCREGFGLVAIEAMALGKPVVVSCRGALPEIVNDGTTGLVFDPAHPGDLAKKLSTLISDSRLAARIGASGKRSVELRFTSDRWTREVLEQLAAAASSRGSGKKSKQKEISAQENQPTGQAV